MEPARGPTVFRVPGGRTAPRRAREVVVRHLGERIDDREASDLELVLSELVTNAVLHAGVGPKDEVLIRVLVLDHRLRISVEDPGSEHVPRPGPPDLDRGGGMGLNIVEQVSTSWGVARTGAGTTSVWCDLPLHRTIRPVPDVPEA